MNIIGIAGEYNPFHRGHMHHFEESRRLLGADSAIICVMSGDFVQRGEPAAFDKHLRAEAAAKCGADLVFELPLPWSLSSAEGFARGCVGLLGSLGCVTHLSFGSERGELEPLDRLALTLMEHSTNERIKERLSDGIPYAAARQAAVAEVLGEDARLLETANNILAVEYLKALHDQRLSMQPVTVLRVGAAHDRPAEGSIRSASDLRGMLERGADIAEYVPSPCATLMELDMQRGRGPVFTSSLETAILSRLRMLGLKSYESLPDATEGLGARLCRAAWTESTLDSVLAAAKTKRYAMSRIRRMTMCAALGVKDGMNGGAPPYARLLAATEKGRQLLREMSGRSAVPIITKPAAVKELDGYSRKLFDLTAAARDLYVLGYPAKEERRAGSDWRSSPVMV